jgi:hypothetical protein
MWGSRQSYPKPKLSFPWLLFPYLHHTRASSQNTQTVGKYSRLESKTSDSKPSGAALIVTTATTEITTATTTTTTRNHQKHKHKHKHRVEGKGEHKDEHRQIQRHKDKENHKHMNLTISLRNAFTTSDAPLPCSSSL